MSRWPAAGLVAATILTLSSIPASALPGRVLFRHMDKVVHLVEYLVLGALLFHSLRHEFSGNPRLAAIIAVCAGATFAALDEWHQGFIGRTPSGWDLFADVAGLICGTVCIIIASRGRGRHGG